MVDLVVEVESGTLVFDDEVIVEVDLPLELSEVVETARVFSWIMDGLVLETKIFGKSSVILTAGFSVGRVLDIVLSL